MAISKKEQLLSKYYSLEIDYRKYLQINDIGLQLKTLNDWKEVCRNLIFSDNININEIKIYQDKLFEINKRIETLEKTTQFNKEKSLNLDSDKIKKITTFKDIIGMEEVKNDILDMVIYPIRYPEYYVNFKNLISFGGGIILTGDPGNGKTFFSKAIAGEVDADYYRSVKLGEVLSNSPGEPEKFIASLFQEARNHRVSVIFFDEFEAIASKRGDSDNAKSIDNKLVDALLQQIDSFDNENDNILLLIAATNRVDLLDDAITRPGRFDKIYEIMPPDLESRRIKIKNELSKVRHGNIDIDVFAQKTDKYSYADIQFILIDSCRKAISEGITNNTDSEKVTLLTRHLEKAISDLNKSKLLRGGR
jgi:transitional endoplasmic reticulum ATPase